MRRLEEMMVEEEAAVTGHPAVDTAQYAAVRWMVQLVGKEFGNMVHGEKRIAFTEVQNCYN